MTGGPDPGELLFALAHGVPLVVAGASEEKPELVARVNWSGVGVGLRTQRPKPERLRAAVRRILSHPVYAARAAAMKAEMAAYDGPATAADLVEELAATRAPLTGNGSGPRGVNRAARVE